MAQYDLCYGSEKKINYPKTLQTGFSSPFLHRLTNANHFVAPLRKVPCLYWEFFFKYHRRQHLVFRIAAHTGEELQEKKIFLLLLLHWRSYKQHWHRLHPESSWSSRVPGLYRWGWEFMNLPVRNVQEDPRQANGTTYVTKIALRICFQIFRITVYRSQLWGGFFF